MKKRIQIDVTILSFIIILTIFIYQFPKAYSTNIILDSLLNFVGMVILLKGVYLRMAARGFKKAHSQSGLGLVVSGPYSLVRNPMYLGSFLMGAGFILIVWPWWTLPVFTALFYFRFKSQILKEEVHLKELFGYEYEEYTKKVPRLFPRLKNLLFAKTKEVFPLEYVWTTKEKWGLIGWPVLAVFLEGLQERVVFGFVAWWNIILVFIFAVIIFALAKWLEYRRG